MSLTGLSGSILPRRRGGRGGGPLRGAARSCWGGGHPLHRQGSLRGLGLGTGPTAGAAEGTADGARDEGHLLGVVTQFPGDGSLQLGTGLVQGPQAGLQGPRVLRQTCPHVVVVFLLLEPPEVVLDEEGGVELSNRDLLLQH